MSHHFTIGREQAIPTARLRQLLRRYWKPVTNKLNCDLGHNRAVRAVLKLEIKSSRAGKAGHPMIRAAAVCATHARVLRELGLELVEA